MKRLLVLLLFAGLVIVLVAPVSVIAEARFNPKWAIGKRVIGTGVKTEGIRMSKWDKAAGKYVFVDGDFKDWQPTTMTSTEKWKIGFTCFSEAHDFGHAVGEGIRSAAKKVGGAGVQMISLDNNFPSSTKPIENADVLVNREADFVIDYNINVSLQGAVLKKYHDAKIPVVVIDITAPEGIALFFGGNKYTIGKIAGEASVTWAKNHNWDLTKTAIIPIDSPDLGAMVRQQLVGFRDTILNALPDLPTANVFEVVGNISYKTAYDNMSAWMQGHPQFKHIFAHGIDDSESVAVAKVIAERGLAKSSLVIGAGANTGLEELRRPGENNAFRGTVAYRPLHMGEVLIPMVLDILEGRAVPEEVHTMNELITPCNIGEMQWPN